MRFIISFALFVTLQCWNINAFQLSNGNILNHHYFAPNMCCFASNMRHFAPNLRCFAPINKLIQSNRKISLVFDKSFIKSKRISVMTIRMTSKRKDHNMNEMKILTQQKHEFLNKFKVTEGWHPICFSDEIKDNKPFAFKLHNVEYVLWKGRDNNLHIMYDNSITFYQKYTCTKAKHNFFIKFSNMNVSNGCLIISYPASVAPYQELLMHNNKYVAPNQKINCSTSVAPYHSYASKSLLRIKIGPYRDANLFFRQVLGIAIDYEGIIWWNDMSFTSDRFLLHTLPVLNAGEKEKTLTSVLSNNVVRSNIVTSNNVVRNNVVRSNIVSNTITKKIYVTQSFNVLWENINILLNSYIMTALNYSSVIKMNSTSQWISPTIFHKKETYLSERKKNKSNKKSNSILCRHYNHLYQLPGTYIVYSNDTNEKFTIRVAIKRVESVETNIVIQNKEYDIKERMILYVSVKSNLPHFNKMIMKQIEGMANELEVLTPEVSSLYHSIFDTNETMIDTLKNDPYHQNASMLEYIIQHISTSCTKMSAQEKIMKMKPYCDMLCLYNVSVIRNTPEKMIELYRNKTWMILFSRYITSNNSIASAIYEYVDKYSNNAYEIFEIKSNSKNNTSYFVIDSNFTTKYNTSNPWFPSEVGDHNGDPNGDHNGDHPNDTYGIFGKFQQKRARFVNSNGTSLNIIDSFGSKQPNSNEFIIVYISENIMIRKYKDMTYEIMINNNKKYESLLCTM